MIPGGKKCILAIDLGTSGPKVALVSQDGEVLCCEFEPTSLQLFPDGGAEQDPAEWWSAITKATRRLMARAAVPVETLAAVSCTAQWSGTVAVDRQGQPLMNAIIWMDSRGRRHIRRAYRGLINIEGYSAIKLWQGIRISGGMPGAAGKDSISHILYLKHEHPQTYQATYKFLEPKDYLNLRLTGKFAASFDSIILHWVTDNRDARKVVYHHRLIKNATIDRDKLPELLPSAEILGQLQPEPAQELGLPPDLPVVVGSPDVQSASVGSGAVRDYQGHLYIGTSSWITCHVPFKALDIRHKMASLPSAVPGRYLVTNEQETAGACLSYLRDNIFFCDDELSRGLAGPDVYQIFDRLVESVPPGSERLIFTPWLYGERCPIDDHSVRASFFNQSLHTTRSHLVRAVYEGVAYNSRWLLQSVEKFIRRRLDPINIIGGGAKSAVWCQIFADVCDRTFQQVEAPIEANVRGAALIASASLGLITFEEIPERVKIAATYRPDPRHRKIYDELFREFTRLYHRNRRTFRRLNPF